MVSPGYFCDFGHVCFFTCPIILNNMSKFTSSKFFIFLLALALIGIIAAAAKESYRNFQINKKVSDLNKEIESLEDKNEKLSNLLDYFSSEKALEKEARLKLNLLKEGEKLIIISPEKNIGSENQAPENAKEEQISNFEKWLNYLSLDFITKKR